MSKTTSKMNSTTFLAVDLLVICENDRSANKSLRLKRCLNAENNKPATTNAELTLQHFVV